MSTMSTVGVCEGFWGKTVEVVGEGLGILGRRMGCAS